MTQFFEKALRAVAKMAPALRDSERRPLQDLKKLKQKQMEAERLDRLRNPSDYQGR